MDTKAIIKRIRESGVPIETLLREYMDMFPDEFSSLRIIQLITDLQEPLSLRVDGLERARRVSEERAEYLIRYLQGTMYVDEEAATRNLPVQVQNAAAILEACDIYRDL